MIWVIACKFDPERPVIFDCVRSIREHHPDDPIDVIDSNSDDPSYLRSLFADFAVFGHDSRNRNYALGAYRWAQRETENDFYACIHDSLVVNQNLHHLEAEPLTTVRYFRSPPNPWGADDTGTDIGMWGADQAREHMGLDILHQLGLFDIKPSSKFEQQGTERLAGIALTHLGYDVKNSLQGEMHGFFDAYDATFVEKRHLDRV